MRTVWQLQSAVWTIIYLYLLRYTASHTC